MTRAPLRAQQPMDFAVSHLPPRRLGYQKRRTSSYKDFWLIVAFQGAKMRQKSGPGKEPAEKVVKDIRRATCRLLGRREDPHCPGGPARRGKHRRVVPPEGIVQNLYCRWSKDILEAGKKRLAGDTARALTSDEVKDVSCRECLARLAKNRRLSNGFDSATSLWVLIAPGY